ncbi:DUF4365 domain-containing protein [Amphritea balenae]|uniref:DUF4365 domain-containing protein n=1 Tax=Amphritea balenae TaxID=452629 RepID=A0A3P1SNP4_9GAMM|nr:DUF4365 domain-containing protein [Amphritea balenae]RRC98275.1 DUF4365 domain-containing protein [Amphritea balenae]GGK80584.1 hypothetical protein GCM10007941_33680 [Amphritea balenae]
MSKVKSKPQKIGEAGEGLVRYWAPMNMHSANKFENDYGFDFTFQQFTNNGDQQIATGAFFVVQCKSTTSKNKYKYVTLDKSDIILHLYSNIPVCLLGVDIDKKDVRHLFLDKNLVNKYLDFLNSDSKTLSLNFYTDLNDESEFITNSKSHTQPGFSLTLRSHIINSLIRKYAPGTKLSVSEDSGQTQLNIESPFLTKIVNPNHLFGAPRKDEINDIINKNVLDILKQYYPDFNSLHLYGAVGSDSTISFGEQKTKAITYPHSKFIEYRMKCGLTFRFGPCETTQDGKHTHSSSFTVSDSSFPLFSCQSDVNLFGSYKSSSSLCLNDHLMIQKIKKWEELNSLLLVLKEVIDAFIISPEWFHDLYLSELNSPENYYSYALLSSLVKKEQNLFPEFTLEPESQSNSLKKVHSTGTVPIVFKINNQPKIANIKCNFTYVLNDNDVITGIGIGKAKSFQVLDLDWPADEIYAPEIWAFKNWPAIPMFGKTSIEFKDTDRTLPFEIIQDSE